MNLLSILFEYFKIGLFNVGGGLATLPFLYKLAETRAWFTANEIPQMLAVAEIVPGAIGINLMCYTGMHAAYIAGALCAIFAFALPPIIIICIVQKMYEAFKQNKIVRHTFCGLRPAAAGLLLSAGCNLVGPFLINLDTKTVGGFLRVRECIILSIFYVAMSKTKLQPALFIAAGAVAGIVFKL